MPENIAENLNRLSRAHERYRRQTDGRQQIANVNISSSSLKNVHSLAPHLRGYYITSVINFLHFVWSIASFFHRPTYRIPQPLSTTLHQVFFGPPLDLTPATSKSTHFSPNHSRPFLKHAHTILTYVVISLYHCSYIIYS